MVRHPGYTGYIIFNFATPMVLGPLNFLDIIYYRIEGS